MDIERFIDKFGAQVLSSRTNPKVVALAKLSDKKYRDGCGLFLAEGIKLTREALRAGIGVETVCFAESAVRSGSVTELAEEAAERGISVTLLSDSAYDKISTEKSPQGAAAVLRFPAELHRTDGFGLWQEGKRLMMLDGIRDPGNLGTILRSAEALGADGVILSDCVDLYNPKTVRGAMGTLFRLPVYLAEDGIACVREMRSAGRRVLAAALEERALALGGYETRPSDCVVVGNEGHGLSEELIGVCDAALRIPMEGETESLNAAAAAVCILWEYSRAEISR